MTTPTDDEIVKYVLAQDWGYAGSAVRQALRIAREGLPVPVKDEAVTLWNEITSQGETGDTVNVIRTFLAARDAERDAEVAKLVKAAKRIKEGWPTISNRYSLTAALAKLEPKP
jgi:hypothetical protein